MTRNAQEFPVKVTKKNFCHLSTNMHIYVSLRHVVFNASFLETKFALFVLFQMYNLNGPLVKLMSYLFLNIFFIPKGHKNVVGDFSGVSICYCKA